MTLSNLSTTGWIYPLCSHLPVATMLCGVELSRGRLAEAVMARCRNDFVEPPAPAKVRRLVGKAVRDFDTRFCRITVDHATRSRLEDLVAGSKDGDEEPTEDQAPAGGWGRSLFTELKADPGAPGLEGVFAEVDKLQRVRKPDLWADLFADVSEKKVDKELTGELKKVRGAEAMMLRVAEAALSEPSGTVREVIYPVVGGEKTLKVLAAEAAANEAKYKARIRAVLRSVYSAR
ncbi:hypothetical protein [Tomitella fengzijianii]|uniref:Uncharacterized protein n=1 Tax=Tomitella fengzijianii TaxID=2597660 RepID=A0A516X1H3_9ACTN|nr:hypothetical protein [Tomitella fengzijianii]QDQ96903.1 hypothetical protein FO059_05600 [Tomitella fengzijianii]